jgi:rhodanese-related sulfurtransferase
MMRLPALGLIVLATAAGPVAAQDVRLTEEWAEASFTVGGQTFTIARNQDTAATLTGEFARTSRECPPFCIQPASAAPGVATVAELEVIAFLQSRVANATGLLIDSRLPEFHVQGTIPGAVNVPFAALDATNPYLRDILIALGAADQGGTLDFSNAMHLVLFCNGPWDEQSQRAVRNLIAAGYPPERLSYYRGGMQDWQMLGLTVEAPEVAG